jgi:hypothetical protein
MRQSLNTLAALLLLTGASVAFSQSAQVVAASQKLSLPTGFDARVTRNSAMALSASQVNAITRESVSNSTLEALTNLPKTAVDLTASNLVNSLGTIANGEVVSFCLNLNVADRSVIKEQKLNVVINYDGQAIGGILTVKVDLVPVFSGVGVSNRPLASKTFVAAVDQLENTSINDIVTDLSKQIANDFRALASN